MSPNLSAPYLVILAGVLLWCISLFIPPVIAACVSPALSQNFYAFFSTVCHQYDSRSLHVFGYKLAVCARCSGIYFGFLGGVLLVPFFSKRRISHVGRFLCVAALPMVLDVAMGSVGMYEGNHAIRVLTGLLFGVAAGFALTPILEEAISELLSTSRFVNSPPQLLRGVHYESKT